MGFGARFMQTLIYAGVGLVVWLIWLAIGSLFSTPSLTSSAMYFFMWGAILLVVLHLLGGGGGIIGIVCFIAAYVFVWIAAVEFWVFLGEGNDYEFLLRIFNYLAFFMVFLILLIMDATGLRGGATTLIYGIEIIYPLLYFVGNFMGGFFRVLALILSIVSVAAPILILLLGRRFPFSTGA